MKAARLKKRSLQITGSFILTFILTSAIFFSIAQLSFGQNSVQVDKTVEIKAVAGLKFSKARFTVAPGSTVRISLENADEMMHNMLIVKPDTRVRVVKAAEALGEKGIKMDFAPQSSNVLAHTPLLDPGGKAAIIFKVPKEEAIYPYVCTYPAHGLIMYGAIYATNQPDELPPLSEDPNIPEPIRNKMAASMSMHPYPVERPAITRLFMPESSPAAIAVGMEKDQSYNWDASYSFLRYAWDGGYIDASKQWDAKSQEVAKIEGNIYYRNTTGFPFRIGRQDSIPDPEFQGYRMVDGYPRFMYKMGEITVHELILPAETTPGFRMEYKLKNVNQPIWYTLSNNDNVRVKVSKGKKEGNMIKLTPDQAREFTISIILEKKSEV